MFLGTPWPKRGVATGPKAQFVLKYNISQKMVFHFDLNMASPLGLRLSLFEV